MKIKSQLGELLQRLGLDAGADPKLHNNALKVIIEYLNFAEIISEEGGEFCLNKLDKVQMSEKKIKSEKITEEEDKIEKPKEEVPSEIKKVIMKESSVTAPISININIPSDATEDYLVKIFKKIKEHFIQPKK